MSILHILLDLHACDLQVPLCQTRLSLSFGNWYSESLDCAKKMSILHKLRGLQRQMFYRQSSMTSFNLV
ncbi:hypothetical protein EUGRSUZ_C03099 [Eucalyptus grandis]|uniref:Uncharacterized protein n=2 Tax=Eucalyptus grandis TaxID=71139 RepID=A0ACC3LI20_EUCGR|nr:hypothetical protein EUGRSUZ_C03099 [Eucalyptus grandis]